MILWTIKGGERRAFITARLFLMIANGKMDMAGYENLLIGIYEYAIHDIRKSDKERDIISALWLIKNDPYGIFKNDGMRDYTLRRCYNILNERGYHDVVRRFATNGELCR